MAAKTRIQIAKPDIVRHFDQLPEKVLKKSDLAATLSEQRENWRLAQRTSTQEFINYLVKNSQLKRLAFPFPNRAELRYVWGDVPLLEVLLTLKPASYYTHYTAARMHGLTEQIPKTIYLNHEQPPHPQNRHLEQDRIDAAFSRAPRVSNNVVEHGDVRICLVNGMHTSQLAVINQEVHYDSSEPAKVRVTNLERTLIDITVRPIYAGGVTEVLKAFRLAKDRVSVNRMAAVLQKLGYVYPYHQAIGFYLERAGYEESSLDLMRRFPMEFDFYLNYKMGPTEYVKEWRLRIPKGF
jgi:predicted transcriptional regulator of viral defense system